MTAHLGYPIPSPAIMEKIGTAFRRSVRSFADTNHIPVVRFHKGDRKIEVMGRYLAAQAASGRPGVAAIGVAQEYQNVFAATGRQRSGGVPWLSFTKADRRASCFYLWDVNFGPAFIRVCAYFPYPITVRLTRVNAGTETDGSGRLGYRRNVRGPYTGTYLPQRPLRPSGTPPG